MAEFYIASVYGYSTPGFYRINSTKRLLEFLQEEFGRGEEITVAKIKDNVWLQVKPYSDFVSFVEDNDLFPEILKKNGIYKVKKAMKAFDKMKKELGRLHPMSMRSKGQLFACGECQILTMTEERKCVEGEDDCECPHSCFCDGLTKVIEL
ncbi:hypothetical protein [Brazilian marseillevirus]|uniref:hypothetical protein n=1 Tax=Brazilian marseillevirus TaxID=1813599 RepID=UPI00078623D7|nr:hypothetical protein A3303_gp146 [Brazilian marseillevirus]AMQ10654.1 hypothetical protein [Brazilian marseillevirus]